MNKTKTKSIKAKSFGILNSKGDFWTTDTFNCEYAAQRHIEMFWKDINRIPDFSKFKIVEVTITYHA